MNRPRISTPLILAAAVLVAPLAAEEPESEPQDRRAESAQAEGRAESAQTEGRAEGAQTEDSAGGAQMERRAEGAPMDKVLAEIEVTASYSLNRDEPVSGVALSQEEILRLPHFGDDLYRAMAVMPGIASNDVSAQFNVRGGFYRDTALRIDGIEIFEPYHLKDFQGVFSIIDPDVIGAVDLIPGGFPAEHGDKMAGVLDMTTIRPTAGFSTDLGISLASVWASGSGTFGRDDRNRWLVSARRGYLDLLLEVSGAQDDEEESEGPGPAYWDLIAKLDRDLSASQTLSLKLLASDDSLEERESETDDFGFPEREEVDSTYGNAYLWLTHQALLGSRTSPTP